MHQYGFRPPWLPQSSDLPAAIIRPYPPVEVVRLQNSATTCTHLMEEGSKLLHKIQNDTYFAHELKDAAQKNDHTHVHALVRNAGVVSAVQTTYNPDGIRIDLHTGDASNCSELSIKLCW